MAIKFELKAILSQFRRDMLRMFGFFAIILVGLTVTGALAAGSALIAGMISGAVSFLYFLWRTTRIKSEASGFEAKKPVPAPETSTDIEGILLQALSHPALLIYDGRIKAGNEDAFQLFNLPADQPNRLAVSLRDPEILSALERVRQSGGRTNCEFQPARTPGEFWLAEVTAMGAAPDEDGILIVLSDQKPIRLAHKARADFLANASHELRTPLTSISGFIETMKGPASDDYAAWPRFIDIMDEQTRHMRDLIGDLLSLSSIELREHLQPETTLDLAAAVDETIEALRLIGTARGLTLNVRSASVPLTMTADEGEVKQVIRNLVGNAMKYAPEASEIEISMGYSPSFVEAQTVAARSWAGANRLTLLNPQRQDCAAIWLQVRDAGLGIAPEHLPRLGERFYRVDGSRGGPIEGTGLGLAIVKHIMAHHQGGLAVESIYGKGTSFSVWFPASKP